MPIDIDINDRTPPTPCKTEGCGHPRFHVCFFGQESTVHFKPEVFVREVRRKKHLRPRRDPDEVAMERREKISIAQKRKWDKYREETAGRDKKIVERYATGAESMATLQNEFKVSRGKILKILHEAAARGEVTIRQKGQTVSSQQSA